MRIRTILAAAAAPAALAAVLLGTAGQASAATTGPAENISFFSGGNGDAHWLPKQTGVILTAPDNSSYAGFDMHHQVTTLPQAKPGFSYTETGVPSGGAPRLVFTMSNGDEVTEYAYPATADGATSNTASQFDIYNPDPTHYHYNISWSDVLTLEAQQHVTSEQVVSDTYTGPASVVITSLNDGTAQLIG